MKKHIALIAAILLAAFLAVGGGSSVFVMDAHAASPLDGFLITFDEPVCIVDTDEITIYAAGIEVDDYGYLVIDTLVVNNTDGEEFEVSIPQASVNGVELYPTYCEDVEDTCDEPIEMDLSNVVENAELTDITDIGLTVHIEDDDFDTLYHEVIHIYPYGEDNAVQYLREAADTDIVVVDNDKFLICVIGCEYFEDWGYSVDLYIQNKTDSLVWIEGDDYRLNDVSVDTWYDDIVGGGNVCFSHLEWSQGDLDDAEITEVTSIKFILTVYDETMDNALCIQTVSLEP